MEEKIKFEMEFPIHASPQLLFQYISTPSGLSEWFADNVNSRGEVFTFIWNDSEEKAKLLSKKKLLNAESRTRTLSESSRTPERR